MKVINYKTIKTIEELIDTLRLRFPMYAKNIDEFYGIITGYTLFSLSFETNITTHFDKFHDYLSNINKVSSSALHWTTQIKNESCSEKSEIALFYKYLDDFRNTEYEKLYHIVLTETQRYNGFQYRNKMNMDYPYKPESPPHIFKIMQSKHDKRYYLFYYDNFNQRFNEQSLDSLDRIKNLLKDVFDISLKDKL